MKTLHLALTLGCFLSTPLLAQSEETPASDSAQTAQPSTSKAVIKKKEEERKVKPTSILKAAIKIPAYRHEFSSSIRYDVSSGAVKSADQQEPTEFKKTVTSGTLSYGWLASRHIEPMIEVEYETIEQNIADFSSKGTSLEVSGGFLVNLPQVDKELLTLNYRLKNPLDEFMLATWIPYFGFLIGKTSATDTQGVSSKTPVLDNDLVTKLIFGLRYMVYPHVSLNFSLRTMYEASDAEAEVGSTMGADRSKMRVDFRMLSMSLFL